MIDSADWEIEKINELCQLTEKLKRGDKLPGIDKWFKAKTVILSFNSESTRSRLTLNRAIVEMGGVPINISKNDFHAPLIEDIEDLAEVMAMSASAICIRLLPDDVYAYGQSQVSNC